jgi:type II secretory pathway pseudopilin PulG
MEEQTPCRQQKKAQALRNHYEGCAPLTAERILEVIRGQGASLKADAERVAAYLGRAGREGSAWRSVVFPAEGLVRTSGTFGRRVGFTRLELVLVLVVVAILLALLVPAIVGALTPGPIHGETYIRIRECQIAATAFFNDYGDYPPTHWDELDDLFRYDPDGNGLYDTFDGLGAGTNPSTVNEGIEVFFACVATRRGGVYLEPDNDWLRNVDHADMTGDRDTGEDDVAMATDWYLMPDTPADPIFELVDWWDNPLVYVHSRDYAAHDGLASDGYDFSEALVYADASGNMVPCFAASTGGVGGPRHPNPGGFQLYSWGPDGMPGCAEEPPGSGNLQPGLPGLMPGWTTKSGNVANWDD